MTKLDWEGANRKAKVPKAKEATKHWGRKYKKISKKKQYDIDKERIAEQNKQIIALQKRVAQLEKQLCSKDVSS